MVESNKYFNLKEKLKLLKKGLKVRHKEVFGRIDNNIKLTKEEIKEIDKEGENETIRSKNKNDKTVLSQFMDV